MRIDVTQNDIDMGNPADCFHCPIAVAVRRQLGANTYVMVESPHIEVEDWVGDLPFEAEQFVDAFDKGLPVSPFTFEVEESFVDEDD